MIASKVAIIGTGNIGTDQMMEVIRLPHTPFPCFVQYMCCPLPTRLTEVLERDLADHVAGFDQSMCRP
jgi:hypothetical protein